jgi:hypothetical protein
MKNVTEFIERIEKYNWVSFDGNHLIESSGIKFRLDIDTNNGIQSRFILLSPNGHCFAHWSAWSLAESNDMVVFYNKLRYKATLNECSMETAEEAMYRSLFYGK